MRSVTCPKCERALAATGTVEFGGRRFPVFQCDECLVQTEMFGEPVEIALTFAVDELGRMFDPTDPSPEILDGGKSEKQSLGPGSERGPR